MVINGHFNAVSPVVSTPLQEIDVPEHKYFERLLLEKSMLMVQIRSVDKSYLSETSTHTKCFWKGTASYFTVSVDGMTSPDYFLSLGYSSNSHVLQTSSLIR